MAVSAETSERPNAIPLIREQYGRLNATHKKIADFILQNIDIATFSPLLEISRNIGVSDATLVRFARELGYKGFQELRHSLVEYIRKIIYLTQKMPIQEPGKCPPDIDAIMQKDIDYITKTMSEIDPQRFETLIGHIVSAPKIYCLGWGISSFLAEYLAFNLAMLSYDTVAVMRERRPMLQQFLFAGQKDLLIVFDQLLYSTEVLEAVQYVHTHKPGLKIATVTNGPLAEIVQYADLSFFCHMVGHEFMLISQTAPFCFINAIIQHLAARDRRKTEAALGEFQHAVQSSALHYSQLDLQNYQLNGVAKEPKTIPTKRLSEKQSRNRPYSKRPLTKPDAKKRRRA